MVASLPRWTTSRSTALAFNGLGSLLAVGRDDGSVTIWDFEQKLPFRTWKAHSTVICSLTFSRDGRRLMTGSWSRSMALWDVADGKEVLRHTMETAVVSMRMHPTLPCAIVDCYSQPTVLYQLHVASGDSMEVEDQRESVSVIRTFGDDEEGDQKKSSSSRRKALAPKGLAFDRKGEFLFVSHSDGVVKVFRVSTSDGESVVLEKVAESERVGGGVTISYLSVDRRGQRVLAVCSDRCVRMFAFTRGRLELERTFVDAVNRSEWRMCCFSYDREADYVMASSAQTIAHELYIWSRDDGQLVRTLHGPRSGVTDMAWHPHRAIVCTVASTGDVILFATKPVENWSAFAPDFTELDENVVYLEKESEFDRQHLDCSSSSRPDNDEDLPVDLLTKERAPEYSSSDETCLVLPPVVIPFDD